MLGIILFIISMQLYFSKKYDWALVFFVFFCYRFLSIMPPQAAIAGLDGPDYAVIAMVVALLFGSKNNYLYKDDSRLRFFVIALFIFLICSIIYSLTRYGLSLGNILMSCRQSFILLSYFLIKRIKPEWIEKLLTVLYIITIIHGVLFVIEVITGSSILGVEAQFDEEVGTYRYLNWPSLHEFFLIVSVFAPDRIRLPHTINKYKSFFPFILLSVVFCTFGRLRIVATFLILFYGMIISKKGSNFLKLSLILLILSIPFQDALESRMSHGGETGSDIESIFNGGLVRFANTGNEEGGTFTYRLAMLYERVDVLSKRPALDQVFGFGLESDPDGISRLVKFNCGESIRTADIAYVNLVRNYGFIGTFLFLGIWFRMASLNRRQLSFNKLAFCNYLYILTMLLISFSGSHMSYFSWMFLPLLLTKYIDNTNKKLI